MATRGTKSGSSYVALLRKINVGGMNIISKNDLIDAFQEMGFNDVLTYIQSGNVLFNAGGGTTKSMITKIERHLSARFSYEAQAVVYSRADYEKIVKSVPAKWGKNPSRKYDTLFILDRVRAEHMYERLPAPVAGVDAVACGPGVIFWSASKEKLTRSALMKIPRLPEYRQLTIRNHNTTFKIAELFDKLK